MRPVRAGSERVVPALFFASGNDGVGRGGLQSQRRFWNGQVFPHVPRIMYMCVLAQNSCSIVAHLRCHAFRRSLCHCRGPGGTIGDDPETAAAFSGC